MLQFPPVFHQPLLLLLPRQRDQQPPHPRLIIFLQWFQIRRKHVRPNDHMNCFVPSSSASHEMMPLVRRIAQFPTGFIRCARSCFRLRPSSYSTTAVSEGGGGQARAWDPTVALRIEHPTLVLLEQCSTAAHFKQILGRMLRLHLTSQTFPMSRLLNFAAVSRPDHHLAHALLLFHHFTPSPNRYIYNTMISALSSSSPAHCFTIYKSMLSASVFPDEHTILALLRAARYTPNNGQHIHAHAIVHGLGSHVYVNNSLMRTYFGFGHACIAQFMFDHMPTRDVVSFNIMISGLAREGRAAEGFQVFHDMEASGIEPDEHTMAGLLMCSGKINSASIGKAVHGLIIRKITLDKTLILDNAILDMYAKCNEMRTALNYFHRMDDRDEFTWNIIISGFVTIGELDFAYRVFRESPRRDIISWNVLLSGYALNGDFQTVANLFEKMIANDIRPDKVTAVSLVSAASKLGELGQARCIHGWVIKAYGITDAFLGSGLIDMYCKCGNMELPYIVFKQVLHKDITIWTAMIMGLAFNGHGIKALDLFWEMQENNILPNSVTLVAVLTACSHSGLVDEGYKIFESMKQSYAVEPEIEHYGCIVDIFSRAGRLTDAMEVINRMPMKPSRSIWGAILSASSAYGNLELAEVAMRELLKLEPEEEGGYILLSNLYATCGKWNHADNIRDLMKSKGVMKIAGSSMMVNDGVLQKFISSDKRSQLQAC